jgi:hypothetical protein
VGTNGSAPAETFGAVVDFGVGAATGTGTSAGDCDSMLTGSGVAVDSVDAGLRRELMNGFIVGTVPVAPAAILAGPAVGVTALAFPATPAPAGVQFNVPPAADFTAGSDPTNCVAVGELEENSGSFEAPTIEDRDCAAGFAVVVLDWGSVRGSFRLGTAGCSVEPSTIRIGCGGCGKDGSRATLDDAVRGAVGRSTTLFVVIGWPVCACGNFTEPRLFIGGIPGGVGGGDVEPRSISPNNEPIF